MKPPLIVALALSLSCWSFATKACPITATGHPLTATSASHSLAMVASPVPIRIGEPFSLALIVCDQQDKGFPGTVKATARMPLHKHGMNYQPSVTAQGGGKFFLEGFLFHMPGLWQISFDLRANGLTDRIQIQYQLDK
jgi:hypothetical protein